MIGSYGGSSAATRRDVIASGRIHFTCANEAHRGKEDAFVTVLNDRWAYCEGTPSATDHIWVVREPAVSVGELELARLVRGRARVRASVSGGQASGPSVSRPDTRRASKRSAQ